MITTNLLATCVSGPKMRSLQRACQRQPCGWIAFQTWRLFFLAMIVHLPKYAHSDDPEDHAECYNLCDEMRPKAYFQPFRFQCDDEVFWSRDLRKSCREKCEKCPKQNCDEYIDANKWHCPGVEYKQPCRDHCNTHRQKGNPANYTLWCDDCQGICQACPNSVCDPRESSRVFYCPREILRGECKKQCDRVRKHRMVTEFKFKCSVEYKNDDSEKRTCETICTDHCPEYVCGSSDSDTYTCPAAQLDRGGSCYNFSVEKWPDKDNPPTSEFEWNCREDALKDDSYDWESDCKDACDNNCNKEKFVCDTSDKAKYHIFYFPKKPPPLEENSKAPKGQPSYKGSCKKLCKASHGGGIKAFPLNCEKSYVRTEEKEACKKTCKECGDDVCSPYIQEIHCKGDEKELARLKEIENKIKSDHEKEVKRIKYQPVWDDGGWILTTVFLVLLMIFGGVVYGIINKRRNKPKTLVVTGFVQPQQQQQQFQPQPPPPTLAPPVPPLESSTVSVESIAEPERKHKKHREH